MSRARRLVSGVSCPDLDAGVKVALLESVTFPRESQLAMRDWLVMLLFRTIVKHLFDYYCKPTAVYMEKSTAYESSS